MCGGFEVGSHQRSARRARRALYDLRHTFATPLLMSGVHFVQVSKWLRHSAFALDV
jgi:integrase